MSAVKVALQRSQKKGRKFSEAMSAEVSPDSKCPICLDAFNNISYLDICLHKFCFQCIHEWSKSKAECPLCKQPFHSIYHTIKSEQDYKKYDMQPVVDNNSFGTFGGVRFRYRTTLTGVHRQMQGMTFPPLDNGVMFEASTANSTQQLQDRYIRRMMMRLAAKRRASREGRMVNGVREQEMINFRRELYRRGVRVRNIRDGGRSRDITAEFFRTNPACLHRLIPWLKRELTVIYGAHSSLVNIVQHIVMSRITRYDMGEGAIQEELMPFLQRHTEHFLHEFISFAKAPFNMEAYDQHAVYDCPVPSSNEDSSSNSSVIEISEGEEELDPPGYSIPTLRHSMWDDETPGPSYSTTAQQSRPECVSVLDSDSSSEEDTLEFGASQQHQSPHNQRDVTQGEVNNEECVSDDSDDCVIISVVKPAEQRTPDVIQLSSDSEESASEDIKDVPLLPQHIRFSSLSPAASQGMYPSGQSDNMDMDRSHRLDSKESSSTSSRHKTSSKSGRTERSRDRLRSKDRDHRRQSRSRSPVRRRSDRSPVITYSRGYLQYDSKSKRRDGHSYLSYSHYSRERDEKGTHYTEKRSYYYSSRKYSDQRSRSRSRDSRDRRRDRRRSRSRTCSSSRSPSKKSRSHNNKPGGKRKCKTRHLEEGSPSKPDAEGDAPVSAPKHRKKSKEKSHKRSKERSRKTSRSPSVDENCHERSKRHHKKKKKHKKKSKKHKSRERTGKDLSAVVAIDSDGSSFVNDGVAKAQRANEDDDASGISADPAPSGSLCDGSTLGR